MLRSRPFCLLFLILGFFTLGGQALAADEGAGLALRNGALTNGELLQIASVQGSLSRAIAASTPADGGAPFKERAFTANKVHKYLGLGSIAAAGLALISPKETGGAHEAMAQTAAGLGVAAVATGLVFHWDDINLGNGLSDPDNLHATLTTLGTIGYLVAVSQAPDELPGGGHTGGGGHAGAGGFGAISMALGIKYNW